MTSSPKINFNSPRGGINGVAKINNPNPISNYTSPKVFKKGSPRALSLTTPAI
jgi:hypothetical protein